MHKRVIIVVWFVCLSVCLSVRLSMDWTVDLRGRYIIMAERGMNLMKIMIQVPLINEPLKKKKIGLVL